jgi:hypothetical protein
MAFELTHPLLQRLYLYWNTKRGARAMPSRGDIDPVDFAYVLGNVILVDVQHEPLRFRFRLHGSKLRQEVGYELTGRMLDELPMTEYRQLAEASLTQAVMTAAPFHAERDQFMDSRRRSYETLILPLSDDGVRINMLLVGQFYKPRD